MCIPTLLNLSLFQSTLPVGGATRTISEPLNFGEISIHAPRGGSDHMLNNMGDTSKYFNPRSPWGERPPSIFPGASLHCISIHAPRGGSDHGFLGGFLTHNDFNPRSPWGERRHGSSASFAMQDFNPRSPWGERPSPSPSFAQRSIFQSTLPVGGATAYSFTSEYCLVFQSTLPVGGATCRPSPCPPGSQISIHAPRGGSDAALVRPRVIMLISIHAPRGGSDLLFV